MTSGEVFTLRLVFKFFFGIIASTNLLAMQCLQCNITLKTIISPDLVGTEFDSQFIYDDDISNRTLAENYGLQGYGPHIKTIVTASISVEVPSECKNDIGEKVKTRLEGFVTNLQRVEIVGKRKNGGRKYDTQIDYAIGLIYRGRANQEDLNDQLRYASTGNRL